MILYTFILTLLNALKQVVQEIDQFTLQILSTPGHIYEPTTRIDHIKSLVLAVVILVMWVCLIPALVVFGLTVGLYMLGLWMFNIKI